jgi:hypothetical protein
MKTKLSIILLCIVIIGCEVSLTANNIAQNTPVKSDANAAYDDFDITSDSNFLYVNWQSEAKVKVIDLWNGNSRQDMEK